MGKTRYYWNHPNNSFEEFWFRTQNSCSFVCLFVYFSNKRMYEYGPGSSLLKKIWHRHCHCQLWGYSYCFRIEIQIHDYKLKLNWELVGACGWAGVRPPRTRVSQILQCSNWYFWIFFEFFFIFLLFRSAHVNAFDIWQTKFTDFSQKYRQNSVALFPLAVQRSAAE